MCDGRKMNTDVYEQRLLFIEDVKSESLMRKMLEATSKAKSGATRKMVPAKLSEKVMFFL